MEIYKREVGYEQFGRTSILVVTATTLNFPFMLKQSFEDIGIYTDVANPVYEIVDLSGIWNLTNNGLGQKPCLTLNNCTVNITEPISISYYGASNGALSASISSCPSPQTIEWSGPNGFTSNNLYISGLKSGNYTLKTTDANCDITYATYFLQQPQGLSFSLVTTDSQHNATSGCNGSASITPQGGQPPYTYLWYSGTTSNILNTTSGITSLCAGIYTVQITDNNGTVVSSIFTITEPTSVSGSVVTTGNIDCNGSKTGTIIVTASGGIASSGYTYMLTGPTGVTNTTGSFVDLPGCPGTYPQPACYTVQITDGVGNTTFVGPIAITQPNAVTFTTSPTDVSCYGAVNGIITINPAGGTAPYTATVLLNSNAFATPIGNGPFTLSNLDVGNYQISVKDTNNCPSPITNITIKQRREFTVSYTILSASTNGYNIACFGDTIPVQFNTLYTSHSTTNGLPSSPVNIKYYVNNIFNSNHLSNTTAILSLSAGTYNITTVDNANCSATTIVTLTQPPMPLSISYGVVDVEDADVRCTAIPCSVGQCRQGIIDINGGVAPYIVLWSDGSTLLTSNPHCKGQLLTVTVTDNNGCIVGPTNITLNP